MRRLNTSDVFAMARIIKKAKIKESLKDTFLKAGDIKDDEGIKEVGVEAILCIVDGAGNEGVEELVYSFLNSILEVTNADKMELEELFTKLKELSVKNDLASFFKLASR